MSDEEKDIIEWAGRAQEQGLICDYTKAKFEEAFANPPTILSILRRPPGSTVRLLPVKVGDGGRPL